MRRISLCRSLSWRLPLLFVVAVLLGTAGQAQAQWRYRGRFFGPRVFVPPGPRFYVGPRFYAGPRIYVGPARPYYYYPAPPPPIVVTPPQVYVQPQGYAPPLPPPPPVQDQLPPPPMVQQQAPGCCCCQQQLPPPPPMVQQPPPMMYQQAPMYAPPVYAPPVYAPPPRAALPGWQYRVGLGVRFAGVLNTDQFSQSSQLGFGGELLFRVARHLSLEVASEYQQTVDNGFTRFDVPLTFGLRVHIGPPTWLVSPYLVAAGGASYGDLNFLHSHDRAWFVDGQGGGGLELRLGKRFAITGDIRGDARHRMTTPDDATAATTSVDGKPFHPMQDQSGVQFRLGAALYL